jgi:26S proteasome regulatory subunit (ATPase 3-interacting protein)
MYFKQQNRPYSAIQIDDNLHKRISKSMVEKALLSLSEPGQGLIRKEYGKTSIFFPDQSLIADVSPHELDQMDRDIAKLKAEYDKSFQYEKQLKQTLNQ